MSPKRPARRPKSTSVSFPLSVKQWGLESILGAAYLLTDRAYARLSGDKAKRVTVTLTPKAGRCTAAQLKAVFPRELRAQKLRWAIAKNNLPIREYIAEQAVLLAQGRGAAAAPEPASEELTAEQRQEIERLIAEVETEIKTLGERKTPDPKKLSQSWEERQSPKNA